MDCAGQRWWYDDHWVHGDLVTGFVDLYDCDHELHGDWSLEWHELHVHGDGDELEGHQCCFDGFGCRGSVDGSRCADRRLGHCGCDESVGCVVDGAWFDWWCVGHWVHGDVESGFVDVHDCDHELHGHGFDRWCVLYVHGESDERFG